MHIIPLITTFNLLKQVERAFYAEWTADIYVLYSEYVLILSPLQHIGQNDHFFTHTYTYKIHNFGAKINYLGPKLDFVKVCLIF